MRRAAVVRFGAVAVTLGCVALALGGCSGDRDTTEGRRIQAVVKRFALSSGPDACSLLTPKALTTVYGRGTLPRAVAKRRCIAASKKFSGESVTITFVKINDSTTAHATAKTLGGRRYFSVGLQKRRGRWFIDAVVPAQRPG
jgi:hypothetical protein